MKGEARFMWLALATSGSTLVCCALPALLVSLGAGAVLASLVSAIPALVWISKHHTLVFATAGVMLLLGGLLQMRPAVCPIDAKLAEACARYKRLSRVVYALSVLVYLTGAFFAFVLPALKSL
ncbi:hypothetical protein WL29_20795 [Burkholderia ubonensis]|uniref:Mercuric transport protein MerT n=1 Tax=Burkholderia ubonensis TaxID=101571 RepID=A0A125DMA9_9BURK|nr:hypothetical protein [Burkholderia ubonensis]KWA83805.1 hypothetical protein WL29_20795 [Burkholderia ubonensis]